MDSTAVGSLREQFGLLNRIAGGQLPMAIAEGPLSTPSTGFSGPIFRIRVPTRVQRPPRWLTREELQFSQQPVAPRR
jgi:hypothetical protein